MSIYDEAIKEAQDFGAFVGLKLEKVIKALERAKKVEEELEEYKISDKSKEESSIEYYNLYKEAKRKLKKVEELLELYYKLRTTRTMENHHKLCREIDKLEEELK